MSLLFPACPYFLCKGGTWLSWKTDWLIYANSSSSIWEWSMWQLVGKLNPCTVGGQIFQVSSCCQDISITVPKYLDSALLTVSFRSKNWIRYDIWISSVERLVCFSPWKYAFFVCVILSLMTTDYGFFFPLHLTWKQMSFFSFLSF